MHLIVKLLAYDAADACHWFLQGAFHCEISADASRSGAAMYASFSENGPIMLLMLIVWVLQRAPDLRWLIMLLILVVYSEMACLGAGQLVAFCCSFALFPRTT